MDPERTVHRFIFRGDKKERRSSMQKMDGWGNVYNADVEMPHWGHEEHLCLLENIGYLRVAPDDFKQMVKGAKFICKECGRVAGEERNLCAPEKL
jgi:hypothetical protein